MKAKQRSETNHRVFESVRPVYEHLLSTDEWDNTLLPPRIQAAVAATLKKMESYKQDQLPEGTY